jgi:hypothetical protein
MAPKAEKKPAKKVAKKVAGSKGKKGKSKVESFKIYIYKVLKQVRAGLSCSTFLEALSVYAVHLEWCTCTWCLARHALIARPEMLREYVPILNNSPVLHRCTLTLVFPAVPSPS